MKRSLNLPFWKSSSPKLAGGCCPLSLLRIGLGSKVSTWLGPPCMKRWMTHFAVAGSGGVLGANGLGVAAAADCWNRSSAASHPMPKPEVCRNLRRESSIARFSIHIDELAHVHDEMAQTGQGIALQIVERSGPFLGGPRTAERDPPRGLDRRLGSVLPRGLRNPRCEILRLLDRGFAIHQRQRLGRDSR